MQRTEYPISPYKSKCNGFAAVGTEDMQYILGVTVGIGIAPLSLSHAGSRVLDETNAFDLAEVDGPYIGQLNMSTVSSFCGPQGYIWGFDIANNQCKKTRFEDISVEKVEHAGHTIDVFNGNFMVEALQELFGTVEDKRFNIIPGAHTPFAAKNIKGTGPLTLYAAIAIGIPSDRQNCASLLMEDIGMLDDNNPTESKKNVVTNLAKSILQIGINQEVQYKECYIVFKSKEVKKNEMGCALVAAPYFTLAQEAIPRTLYGGLDFERLLKLNLEDWKKRYNKK